MTRSNRWPSFARRTTGALLFSVLALFFAPPSRSQQTPLPRVPPPPGPALSGTVHTREQSPVPGATVRVTNSETGQAWVSWTDEAGKFELPDLPAGKYHIEVSQLGFSAFFQDAQIPISSPLAVTLRVATLAELTAPAASGNSAQETLHSGARRSPASQQAGNSAQNNSSGANPNSGAGAGPGRRGQAQAPPPGVMNALRQGMGGFQQTDLTGQGGDFAGPNAGGAAGSENPTTPSATGNSSDVFLLQGAVGQGAPSGPNFGGPGGPGGPGEFGQNSSFIPGSPGGQVGPGGFGGRGEQGGPGRGGFGGPGGFGGGFPGGGVPGTRGRLARQQVNQVRFSLFDRYENSAFDARPYSITGVESPKISHYTERVGGSLGGPLKIPHVYNGSDRTYFFLNYQHEISASPVDVFSTVPTMDERGGNFCTSPTPVQLFDPNSNISGPRAPLGNGCMIPSGDINSAATGLLAFVPLPNVPCPNGVCPAVQNFHLQATTPLNSDVVSLHILHTINSRWNVNGGYNLNSQRISTLGNFPDIKGTQSTLGQSVSLGLSHNWSPQFVENTTLNWSRNRIQILSDNAFVNNVAGDLGITGVSTEPINFGIPAVNFTDFSGLNDPVPSLVRNQTLRLGDSFNWVHKKHTLTFGGEIRRIELNQTSDPIARGQFTFTGLLTAQLDANGNPVAGTGDDLADFLLGLPYNTRAQFGIANTYFRSWGFVGFAQDDLRVNKRFTFLYGVRYEAVTPPVEINNQIANLDLAANNLNVDVVTPGQPGQFLGQYPRALVHGDYNDWAPRIGFAWQPFDIKPKTVIRGGYSIFYNESAYNTLAQQYLAYQPPFSTSQNLLTSATQILTLQNGFPSAPANLPPCTPQVTSDCVPISNTGGINPFYRPAYAQIWSLGTETELTHTWLLDITYTGTKGTNLDILRAPNRAPLGSNPLDTQNELQIPYANSFYYDQSGANSIYNALQVRLMHRFTSGLMLQATYTFSKSLDDASTIGGGSAVVVQNDQDFRAQYGLSSFDQRHQFRFFSVYELPFGERHRFATHGWKEKALSNWRMLNIVTWHTGTPFTAYLGGAAANNSGTGANFSERADQIADPNIGLCGGAPLAFFNTAAFVAPPTGQFGDAQRNSIEGPCAFNWNFSIGKSVRFGPDQRHHLDVRWEVNNLTNTPAFTGLSTTLGSTFFGRITAAGSMRTMDINVRFNF